MKIYYYRETDTLYFDLLDEPSVESQEIAPDIVVDYNDKMQLVGFTIDHASTHTNLSTVEVNEMPNVSVKTRPDSELVLA